MRTCISLPIQFSVQKLVGATTMRTPPMRTDLFMGTTLGATPSCPCMSEMRTCLRSTTVSVKEMAISGVASGKETLTGAWE